MSAPTPHNCAKKGDFAEAVIMPGDPKRARFIAENRLNDVRLVNDVRGIQGYTGYFKGCPVSVMASGMGMPSIGIYSHELFSFYGVERIIRAGSVGGMENSVKIHDIIIAMGACTDSGYLNQFDLPGTFAPICDFDLLKKASDIAAEKGLKCHIGNVLSTDAFYNADLSVTERWLKMGVLGVEMETAALYANAAYLKKSALSICTVSDHLISGESLTPDERERGFSDMIDLSLETAVL